MMVSREQIVKKTGEFAAYFVTNLAIYPANR